MGETATLISLLDVDLRGLQVPTRVRALKSVIQHLDFDGRDRMWIDLAGVKTTEPEIELLIRGLKKAQAGWFGIRQRPIKCEPALLENAARVAPLSQELRVFRLSDVTEVVAFDELVGISVTLRQEASAGLQMHLSHLTELAGRIDVNHFESE